MTAMSAAPPLRAVILEGPHVRLEPLGLHHAGGLLAAASGSRDSYGFTTVPDTEEQVIRYIETALAERDAGRALPFATVDRAQDRVVGSTRFGHIEFWPWPVDNPHQRGAEF